VSQTKKLRILGINQESVVWRIVHVLSLVITFLLSALAGHFYENSFWFTTFAVSAILTAVATSLIPEALAKSEIEKIESLSSDKITKLEEKIQNLQERISELESKSA